MCLPGCSWAGDPACFEGMSKAATVAEITDPPRSTRTDVKVLLICLAILVLLSMLTFGGFNYVKAKQARAQARLQVSLLKNALAVYKADTGRVPEHAVIDGKSGTQKLHAALFPGAAGARIYVPELDPASDPHGWLAGKTGPLPLKIYDPWGNDFHYRSNAVGVPGVIATHPDFDLWSAGPDGKTTATAGGGYNPLDPDNLDDIGF